MCRDVERRGPVTLKKSEKTLMVTPRNQEKQAPAALVCAGTDRPVHNSGKLLPWEVVVTLLLSPALDHLLSPGIGRFHPVQHPRS